MLKCQLKHTISKITPQIGKVYLQSCYNEFCSAVDRFSFFCRIFMQLVVFRQNLSMSNVSHPCLYLLSNPRLPLPCFQISFKLSASFRYYQLALYPDIYGGIIIH